MTMRLLAFASMLVVLATSALSCAACSDPPLPRAPGAVAVVVARTADVLAIESALVRAGLVSSSVVAPLGPALVADAPVVASVMPTGVVIVATRASKSAASTIGATRPVVGDTVAVVVAGQTLLARVDGTRALVAFNVEKSDEASTAAVLEIMAADKAAVTPALPAAGVLSVDVEPAASLVGAAHVDVKLEGTTLMVTARAPAPAVGVRDALASPAPAWACALDEGAAAVLAIPPMSTDPSALAEEPFGGRMMVAIYAPAPGGDEERQGMASVVVAGAPKGTKARDDLLAGLREGGAQMEERTETTPDGRSIKRIDVNARRVLRAVVGDDRFALAVGEAARAPIDRVARGECPASDRSVNSAPLVRLDGAKLQRLLLPMLVTPDVILRALASSPGDADAIPLARLRGVQRIDVDATTDGAQGVRIDAKLVLASAAAGAAK